MDERTKEYAPVLVRIGMSAVFLWFGISQLLQPKNFIGYLPAFLLEGPANAFVMINGGFEVALGTMLVLGIYVRPVALLLGLHLMVIMINVGYNEIGVRDFGLMVATFTIFLWGEDKWCLMKRLKRKA